MADDPDAPLWRAASAFRLITVVYAVGHQAVVADDYRSVQLSWVFVALAVMWSGVAGLAVLRPGIRIAVVLADQVVTVALVGATRIVAEPGLFEQHQVLPTGLWVTNAVISAAIARGPVAGVVSGLVMAAAVAVTRGQFDLDLWQDATGPILLSVGLALGVASTAARRAQRRLEAATGLAAAAHERERLAREVHDGVLQVLAMVTRRGNEIGGEAKELATLANEQEIALRRLVSANRSPVTARGAVADLRTTMQNFTGVGVSVSCPGDPVLMPADTATEVEGAVRSALANVADHAGAGASAFVLVEDLGTEVVVSIRDDGAGMTPTRPGEAAAEGRMGISRSIVGRIDGVGGTATIESAPGLGTEWEFRIPLQGRRT